MIRHKNTLALFCAPLGLLFAGCWGGHLSVEYREDRPTRRHREGVHVCSRSCHHHYYDDGRYVILKGHRHRDGCGHHWNGTHWVVRHSGSRRHSARHVCSRSCHHHYHDGSKLIVLDGHRHRPDCGHRWDGTYWVASARTHRAHPHQKAHPYRGVRQARHTHDARCGCVYDRRRTRWIAIGRDHTHRPGCGHMHVSGRWCLR